jgi:hypothetical protein
MRKRAFVRDPEPYHPLPPGADWGDAYALQYRAKADQNRARKQRQREQDAARPKKEAARRAVRAKTPEARAERAELAAAKARFRRRHPGAEPETLAYFQALLNGGPDGQLLMAARHDAATYAENARWRAEKAGLKREQRAEISRLIHERRTVGYHHPGGAVGGNPDQQIAPFTYRGLVSHEDPVLMLFAASCPATARLQTGNDKGGVSTRGSKLLALDDAYAVANQTMRRVLRVDVDRTFPGGFAELAALLAAHGVPLPNIVVGHEDAGGCLHNPHLLWLIADAVNFGANGKRPHQALFLGVLEGLTAACLPLGADPGGTFNAMKVKNPLCPLWDRFILASVPYSLADLAPALDLPGARGRLRAAPARQGFHDDHPDPGVAVQSNARFHHLATFARHHAPLPDADDGAWAEFGVMVEVEAMRICPPSRGAEDYAERMAERVIAWTRKRYRRPAPSITPEERKARLSAGGRAGQTKAAPSRKGENLAAFIAAAQRILAEGGKVTQPALVKATGKGERTVRRHWPEVLAGLGGTQDPAIQPPRLKSTLASPAGPARVSASLPPLPGPPAGAVLAASFHSRNTAQDAPLEPRQPQPKTKRVGGGWRRADA